MNNDEIVQFALMHRSEGYISGCTSLISFMRGWVSNSPMSDQQRKMILRGLDEALNDCLSSWKGNDEPSTI